MVWLSSFCTLRGAPPPRLPPLAHSLAALVTSPLLLAEHFGVSKPHTACRLAPSALVTSPLLLAEHFGVSKPHTACRLAPSALVTSPLLLAEHSASPNRAPPAAAP